MSDKDDLKKVEMYEIKIVDIQGLPKAMHIPIGWKEAYMSEFGKGIPSLSTFNNWKEKMDKRQSIKPNLAYRFTPELKAELYDFLNNKPVSEVEHLIAGLFEVVEKDAEGKSVLDENGKEKPVADDAIYYTSEGVQLLVGYLRDKCPRKEGKPLIDKLVNGGLIQFSIGKKDKEEETPKG